MWDDGVIDSIARNKDETEDILQWIQREKWVGMLMH